MCIDKKILINWCGWFFACNIILFFLIGSRYFAVLEWSVMPELSGHGKMTLSLFAVLAFIGHLGLLALSPLLIMLPIICLFPKKKIIIPLAIIFAMLTIVLLIADVMTYQLYHFHLHGMIATLLFSGLSDEIFGFSAKEYFLAAILIIGIGVIELTLAILLWKYLANRNKKFYFSGLLIGLALALYCSYLMIAVNAPMLISRLFADIARTLPLYTAILPIDSLSEHYLVQQQKSIRTLRYPLGPIVLASPVQPLNWLLIVIDTWRFDMLQQSIMPTVFAFSKQATVFQNHLSGGNATGPGIFSLFYGLPVTYWSSMETQRRGPVLIDALLQQGYQIGLFASAPLGFPHFEHTVFSAIKNFPANTLGKTVSERDEKITEEFKEFIVKVKKQPKPFFGFLFYDGAHSYCSYPITITPFLPMIQNCNRSELTAATDPTPYFNRYKNALFLIDLQIQQVLTALKKQKLLDKTVVMITGDHGEQFNEGGRGLWGHSSDFNRYQVQTPLVVYWPGRPAKTVTYPTSHYNIAPTMMRDLLGYQGPVANFSVGGSLFNSVTPSYLILGSYNSFAIKTIDQLITVFPAGNFRIQKADGQSDLHATLNRRLMQQVFHDMQKYYQIS